MKLTPQTLQQLIKEELEVILTDDEAMELFGDQIKRIIAEVKKGPLPPPEWALPEFSGDKEPPGSPYPGPDAGSHMGPPAKGPTDVELLRYARQGRPPDPIPGMSSLPPGDAPVRTRFPSLDPGIDAARKAGDKAAWIRDQKLWQQLQDEAWETEKRTAERRLNRAVMAAEFRARVPEPTKYGGYHHNLPKLDDPRLAVPTTRDQAVQRLTRAHPTVWPGGKPPPKASREKALEKATAEWKRLYKADKLATELAAGAELPTAAALDAELAATAASDKAAGVAARAKTPAWAQGAPDPRTAPRAGYRDLTADRAASQARRRARKAARRAAEEALFTTAEEVGEGAASGVDDLLSSRAGREAVEQAAAQGGKKGLQRLFSKLIPGLALADAAYMAAEYGKWAGKGWMADAPEWARSGEGIYVDPRTPAAIAQGADWDKPGMTQTGGVGLLDIDPTAPIARHLASRLRGQPEPTPRKRMVGGGWTAGKHVPASEDPEYLAAMQAKRDAAAEELKEELTPASLRQMVIKELGFGEGTPANDEWSKKKTYIVEDEGEQLELPGLETPALCEPADGVDDLSSQLAQMVVDSGMPPEALNDLMELIYDKVAGNLEGIGVEDADDYQRTTMGFMEALRKATLNILAEHGDGTGTAYVDPSGESVPEEDPPAQDQEIAAAGAEGEAAAESETATPAQNSKQVAAQETAAAERKRSNAAAMAEQKELARYTKLAGIHGEIIK
jgi:hypothetical protein